MVYLEAFSKVLPVLFLIGLGAVLHRLGFMNEAARSGFKQLVVNITLPAALFLAFAGVSLEGGHLVIVAIIFFLCLLALLGARLRRPLAGIDSDYLPPLATGFEAGMMGYAIYGAVFGADNIFQFAVIDLGQVLFVFFILVPYVQRLSVGPAPFTNTLRNFLRTPVILSILLGILANRLGLAEAAAAWPVSAAVVSAVLDTLRLLAAATTPLITLVIGYEVSLQWDNLAAPLRTVGLRMLYWVPAGMLLNFLVIGNLFPGNRLLQAAVMTMFVLPPPFVIPIFMSNARGSDQMYVVNTLSLATIVTLVAFTIVSVLYAV
jgi:malate permease and related proteins